MSSFLNVTLEDNLPSIIYSGGWDGDDHKGDTKIQEYSNANFHASETQGDSLLFSWNGGPIWLYGAKRPNHGHFSVSLDGAEKMFKSGFAPSNQFKALLWSSGDLPDGQHEVVIVNEKGHAQTDQALAWFDLDYIIVQADPAKFGTAAEQKQDTDALSADTAHAADQFITTGQPKLQLILSDAQTNGCSRRDKGLVGLVFENNQHKQHHGRRSSMDRTGGVVLVLDPAATIKPWTRDWPVIGEKTKVLFEKYFLPKKLKGRVRLVDPEEDVADCQACQREMPLNDF